MEILTQVQVLCPFCGETFVETIDTTEGSHITTVEDCAVCCRPIDLVIDCRPGEVTSIHADR